MNEFTPTPEIQHEQEPTVAEVVDLAFKDGFIDTEDRNDMFEKDIDEVIGDLYGIIIEEGQDPDEIFASWGILATE